jgi:hypothetical protein
VLCEKIVAAFYVFGLLTFKKFQAPKIKSQTNPNDPNSKFQTNDQNTVLPLAKSPAETGL